MNKLILKFLHDSKQDMKEVVISCIGGIHVSGVVAEIEEYGDEPSIILIDGDDVHVVDPTKICCVTISNRS